VGYSFYLVDGVRYCTYEGQYYLPVSGGYRVVPDPRYTVSQPLLSNQVTVTSDRLNVRSGPGLQYYTAGIVYRGDILQVLRRNVDWLYVRLPDNNRGWIMRRFTEPAGQRADG
ncbi:MAG: SH3 domain-containing protein, partial [Candidatus Electrothrix sp. EH2]|nr:SH3 domain-containing protein [Candidatus Electrothrix sp. EH2]